MVTFFTGALLDARRPLKSFLRGPKRTLNLHHSGQSKGARQKSSNNKLNASGPVWRHESCALANMDRFRRVDVAISAAPWQLVVMAAAAVVTFAALANLGASIAEVQRARISSSTTHGVKRHAVAFVGLIRGMSDCLPRLLHVLNATHGRIDIFANLGHSDVGLRDPALAFNDSVALQLLQSMPNALVVEVLDIMPSEPLPAPLAAMVPSAPFDGVPHGNSRNLLLQLYRYWLVHEHVRQRMQREGFKYDSVLLLRPDVCICNTKQQINLDTLFEPEPAMQRNSSISSDRWNDEISQVRYVFNGTQRFPDDKSYHQVLATKNVIKHKLFIAQIPGFHVTDNGINDVMLLGKWETMSAILTTLNRTERLVTKHKCFYPETTIQFSVLDFVHQCTRDDRDRLHLMVVFTPPDLEICLRRRVGACSFPDALCPPNTWSELP